MSNIAAKLIDYWINGKDSSSTQETFGVENDSNFCLVDFKIISNYFFHDK